MLTGPQKPVFTYNGRKPMLNTHRPIWLLATVPGKEYIVPKILHGRSMYRLWLYFHIRHIVSSLTCRMKILVICLRLLQQTDSAAVSTVFKEAHSLASRKTKLSLWAASTGIFTCDLSLSTACQRKRMLFVKKAKYSFLATLVHYWQDNMSNESESLPDQTVCVLDPEA